MIEMKTKKRPMVPSHSNYITFYTFIPSIDQYTGRLRCNYYRDIKISEMYMAGFYLVINEINTNFVK